MRILITLLICCGSLLSCRHQKIVSEDELKRYIMDPENGLLIKKSKNDIDVEVIYRPSALTIAQQLDGIVDKEERSKTIKNFDSLSYFVIKLSRRGQEVENAYVSDTEKFARVTSYLSSTVAQNIYLTTPKGKIPALDAVYTRMFGAASATSVMVIFDDDLKALNGKLKFHFDDTELGLGQNEFEFDTDDIKKTPTLNFN